MTDEEYIIAQKECAEVMNAVDVMREKEQDEKIKELNLIPVHGDVIQGIYDEIKKWWEDNNMTREKYRELMEATINKYAEQGEKRDELV